MAKEQKRRIKFIGLADPYRVSALPSPGHRMELNRLTQSPVRDLHGPMLGTIRHVVILSLLCLSLAFPTAMHATAACGDLEDIPLLGSAVEEASLPQTNVNIHWVVPTGDIKGVLALFHGGNQSSCILFDYNIELQELVHAALDRGLVVGGWSSDDQGISCSGGDWEAVLGGADFTNSEEGLNFLLDEAGKQPGEVPIFFVGGSRGGAMASALPAYLNLISPDLAPSAVALFISAGAGYENPAYGPNPDFPPTLFIPGEHDSGNPPAEVMERAWMLESAGTPGGVLVNTRDRVRATEISRIPGISCPDAVNLVLQLEAVGLVDAQGRLLEDPGNPGPWQAALSALPGGLGDVVADELAEYWAGHTPTGEFTEQLLDFFAVHAP